VLKPSTKVKNLAQSDGHQCILRCFDTVIRRIKFDTRRGGTLVQWVFIRLSPPSSRKLVASKTRAFSLECDQLNATSSVGLTIGVLGTVCVGPRPKRGVSTSYL